MFFNRNKVKKIKWNVISEENDIDSIIELSHQKPCLIFKHSTRCSISTMAKNRLERNWDENVQIEFYYLDLLAFRSVSNKIATLFDVEHQSPQVLLIKMGECKYTSTHNDIDFDKIKDQVR